MFAITQISHPFSSLMRLLFAFLSLRVHENIFKMLRNMTALIFHEVVAGRAGGWANATPYITPSTTQKVS
jgi:hypothetical protein